MQILNKNVNWESGDVFASQNGYIVKTNNIYNIFTEIFRVIFT